MLKEKAIKSAKFTALALATLLLATNAVAETYNSSVVLPAVHTRYYTYTATVPVKGAPPATGKIERVTWNWSVVGWPDTFSVRLCHETESNCVDVSRMRSGSTDQFVNRNPQKPFFFALRAGANTLVPVGGQAGILDVQWRK